MIAAQTIDAKASLAPILDWNGLVTEGRDLLAAMTDGGWTDFNAHDPGITILELLAYALTDLGYRAGHSVADLIAGAAPLPGPAELLAGRAVTLADLRRVALDVPGVRNVWIEPADHAALRLRHQPGAAELDFDRGPATPGVPVRLAGVHRVLIEKSSREDLPTAEVARGVAAALHANRNLGEDFDAFDVLDPLPIAVVADLEIDDPARAEAILLDLWGRLDAYCSPRPDWLDAAALRARGWTTEAIYEGPAADGGRLDDGGRAPARRAALHLSDVIAALSAADGVRATRRVRLGATGDPLDDGPARWSLPIPADRAPRFDPRGGRIRLLAGGGVALDSTTRDDLALRFGEQLGGADRLAGLGEAAVPPGRDRRVADYRPLRMDLPPVYGVRPGALGDRTTPERRAQAAQLRGYLAIFDALLANQFAQLAGAGALLGPGADSGTYFTRPAEPIVTPSQPGDEPAIHADGLTAAALQALVEPPGADEGVDRRNRLLAHLLARYGEAAPAVPPPRATIGPDAPASRRVLAARERFLAAFPRLSAGRGAGANLLDPADESPLLDRVRLKLGLAPADADRLLLVEHVLLRAVADDDGQALPILAGAARADPYSLQLSLVADARLRPAADALARVARDETPAHLVLYIRWLETDAFDAFATAHARWRETLAKHRRETLAFGGELG